MKHDLEDYNQYLQKKLKNKSIDNLEVIYTNYVQLQKWLVVRESRSKYWNYISSLRNYIRTLSDEQFEALIAKSNKHCLSLDQGPSRMYGSLVINTFRAMRDVNKDVSIGKYIRETEYVYEYSKFKHIVDHIFMYFWGDMYVCKQHIKYSKQPGFYKGKQVCIYEAKVLLGIGNDYMVFHAYKPIFLYNQMGMIVEYVNNDNLDNVCPSLDFLLLCYDHRGRFIIEETDNYIKLKIVDTDKFSIEKKLH